MTQRILIVEDHADIRRLIRMTLEFENHEIHEAVNADEGLEAVRQLRPQLLLLDIMMPGQLDGLDLCRLVKSDPSLGMPQVILLTARGQSQDIEAGMNAGADAYLLKPFSPPQIDRDHRQPGYHSLRGSMNLTAPEATQFDPAAADQMEKIISDLGRMYHERNEALQEVARAHHEALFLLAMAAEYKDDDTGVHIVRIGFLAEALASFLGEPKAYARLLRKAAPMHDIGKIGIPDSVLKKPGPLTPEERLIMNQHPAIGADILGKSRIALFRMAAEIALTHHERWDGQGYPPPAGRPGHPAVGAYRGSCRFLRRFDDGPRLPPCFQPRRSPRDVASRERQGIRPGRRGLLHAAQCRPAGTARARHCPARDVC